MGQNLGMFLVVIGMAACAAGPGPVVNAGPSDPSWPRPPVSAQTDRTDLPAWEFGQCASDLDCAPRGCASAMCTSDETPAVCAESAVGACLATIPAARCGCVEGVCRWARSVEVMQCAHRAGPRPQTRPFEGGESRGGYPSSHHR